MQVNRECACRHVIGLLAPRSANSLSQSKVNHPLHTPFRFFPALCCTFTLSYLSLLPAHLVACLHISTGTAYFAAILCEGALQLLCLCGAVSVVTTPFSQSLALSATPFTPYSLSSPCNMHICVHCTVPLLSPSFPNFPNTYTPCLLISSLFSLLKTVTLPLAVELCLAWCRCLILSESWQKLKLFKQTPCVLEKKRGLCKSL